MRMLAYQHGPPFRLILYWKRVQFYLFGALGKNSLVLSEITVSRLVRIQAD
jgi:hypothetical protein